MSELLLYSIDCRTATFNKKKFDSEDDFNNGIVLFVNECIQANKAKTKSSTESIPLDWVVVDCYWGWFGTVSSGGNLVVGSGAAAIA